MPKQEGQKSKLLALLRIFETQTDENHLLNVPQLVGLLEQQGILCERKSVYSDIDALNALGYEIWLRRGRGGGYYMASRMFDLAELKLLVDAVQASRVVSSATSRRLIRKLEKLCSNYEGSQLQRQVYVDGRPKTDSKSLLYSVDALHEAINAGKMVEFHYKKVGRPEKRAISPWQMAWENGCYYLIAYQDEKEPVGIRHYRVDKMSGVRVLERTPPGQGGVCGLRPARLPEKAFQHVRRPRSPRHPAVRGGLGGRHAGALRRVAPLPARRGRPFPLRRPHLRQRTLLRLGGGLWRQGGSHSRPEQVRAGMQAAGRTIGERTYAETRKMDRVSAVHFLVRNHSSNSRSLGRSTSSAAAGSATRRRLWWKMAFSRVLRAKRPLPAVRASAA